MSNVRSLASVSRIDFILNSLQNSSTKLAFFTETFLTDDKIPDSFLYSEFYHFIRFDRRKSVGSTGGGVLVYISKTLNFQEIDISTDLHYSKHGCEVLSFDLIPSKSDCIRFFLVYRPPNTTAHKTQFLCEHLKNFLSHGANIILGDLNCPSIDWVNLRAGSNSAHTAFFDFCTNENMSQMVNFPTRTALTGTENVLDLLLTNSPDLITNVEKQPPLFNSDHHSVEFVMTLSKPTTKANKTGKRQIFDFKRADFEKINSILVSIHWNYMFSFCSSFQAKYDLFIKTVSDTLYSCCPTKILNDRRPKNRRLAKLQRKKRKYAKKYGISDYARRKYKIIQKDILKILKIDRISLEESAAKSNKSISKYIKSRLKFKHELPALSYPHSELKYITDFEKANAFVDCFSNNINQEIKSSAGVIFPQCKQQKLDISFDAYLVYNYLRRVPSKFSVTTENINQFCIKKCAISLAEPLSVLFTESFEQGIVPRQWKVAYIVPVHKKGLRSNPFNYRPISLTSPFCRVMERMISTKLKHRYAQKLSANQFGFLPKRSCTLSLLDSISCWQEHLRNKRNVDVIYFDFKKAFDMVPHSKLLLKLNSVGVDYKLISWLRDFLTNRTSYVKVGDALSSHHIDVSSGVVQGSVLGPMLFLMYINDISFTFGADVQYTLFADDLKIYGTNPSSLQSVINSIGEWAETWDMPLAVEKIRVLHLGRNNPKTHYYISGELIASEDVVRDLGLRIDNALKFDSHINFAVNKANALGDQILRAFRFDVPQKYIWVFNTYAMPHLDYCSEIFSPPANSRLAKVLEQPLRRFTRSVCQRFQLRFSSYSERLQILNIDSIFLRNIKSDLLLAYKIIHHQAHSNESYLTLSRNPRHRMRMVRHFNPHMSNWFWNRVSHNWNLVANRFNEVNCYNEFKLIVASLCIHEFDAMPSILR